MKTGVVVVTYNRLELLKECLDNVLNQSVAFTKIVIINNCSNDGTKEFLETFKLDERFEIVNEEENLGGAGGFAKAIQLIQKYDLDWSLIIDDDAMIENCYISKLLDFVEKNPEVNACSGTVKTNGKIVTMHRRRVKSSLLFWEQNVSEKEYDKDYFKCDLGTFCGLFIRHDILKKIGIPNANYFIWYDDTEYCLRLRKYGGIYNVNAAVLNHKTQDAVLEKNIFLKTTWKHYYGYRNRYDTAKKHFSSITTWIVKLQFYVFILCSYLMYIFPKYATKGRYNVEMYKDALRDGKISKLGKNSKYCP